MRQRPTQIKPDIFPENREEKQHFAVRYLDRILMEAFTANTVEEVRSAERRLADFQEQCLEHIRFLSSLESFHRSVVDEIN